MIRNKIIFSFINNNSCLSGVNHVNMYTHTRAFSLLFLSSTGSLQSNRLLSRLSKRNSAAIHSSFTHNIQPSRSFHTSPVVFDNEGINPNFPDEPIQNPRIRKPGRYFAQQLDTSKYSLSNSPIYVAPAGPQVAFTKRASLGLVAIGTYLGYLTSATSASISPITIALALIPLFAPIPIFQYLSKPYVTRIFRLYKKKPLIEIKEEEEELKKPEGFEGDGPKLEGFEDLDDGFPKRPRYQAQPQTLEDLVNDETLVIEQIGNFGRSVHATEVKLKDIRIANERMGWVNWVYKDPETKEELKMYVADNVGGIKMDRIWGVIESNSGIDNGRGFLNEQ